MFSKLARLASGTAGIVWGPVFVASALLALHASPASAACGSATTVVDEDQLYDAIVEFNAVNTNDCVFTISVAEDIPLSGELPVISNGTPGARLIIEGNGHTVDNQGAPGRRVLNVAASTNVTLNELTVTGGNMTGGGVDARGGGILSKGTLTLNRSSVLANKSQNFGGGIANYGGTLTINQSTIANNESGAGGGIHGDGNYNKITIRNSTISGNSYWGIYYGVGELTLDSVTLTDNVQGLKVYDLNGRLSLTNSILAENQYDDCVFRSNPGARLTDGGHNLVYSAPLVEGVYCGVPIGANGNIEETVALLDLADNGGPTLTHAPEPTSPVLDAGATTLAVDQRDHPRPLGTADDIGAFESAQCDGDTWTVANPAEWNAAIDCFNSQTTAGVYTIQFVHGFGMIESSTEINNATAGVSLVIEGGGKVLEGNDLIDDYPETRLVEIAKDTHVTINDLVLQLGHTKTIFKAGAITNAGHLTLRRSTIRNSVGIGSFNVAALLNDLGATALIEDSAIVNNGYFTEDQADALPNDVSGAISSSGSLTLRNSTVSGNKATRNAGNALYSQGPALTLDSVTVTENTLTDEGVSKGAVAIFGPNTIRNSIFFGNTGTSLVDIYCEVVPTVADHNLAGTQSGCFTGGDAGNIVGADPLLGPLANNGGPTRTHALLVGSPAIDAGATDLAADQRGFPRPSGFADDIGAFEATSTNGRLTISKRANPADGTDFMFTIAGGSLGAPIEFTLDSGDTASYVLEAGAYTVTETLPPPPYPSESVQITCTDADGPVGSVSGNVLSLDLQANEDVSCTFFNEVVSPDWTPATIDWKPGSNPSTINLGDKATTPVAILGSEMFDVTLIDIASIRVDDEKIYAGPGVSRKRNGDYLAAYEDVNGDGYLDLVVHFETSLLRAVLSDGGDGTLYLFGYLDGLLFVGEQQPGDPLKLIGP